jgi:hypothetical protein
LDAHRYSYEIHRGPIPAGQIVRHTCDNPGCVNPAHLLLGTQRDNIQDRVRRGRNGIPGAKRKLSPENIERVRLLAKDGVYQRDIAAMFGVCQRTINKIVNRIGRYGVC